MDFTDINYLAVFVAALAGFIIGAIWYSPLLFSKVWVRETGLKEEELKNANMVKIFGTSFVLMFIQSVMLSSFVADEEGALFRMIAGMIIAVGWIVTSIGVLFLFERRSFKLFLIDAGYFVVTFMVMGAILGAWK
ncbi:MAG: DUF1761 domain-containing protein [Ignavibacteriaceae bacterium]|nr:DUF1761 domain-containing protein [Ignavibacteriaceae bacterium]